LSGATLLTYRLYPALSTNFVKLALLSHALCIEHTPSLPPGYPGCTHWEGSCSVLGEPPPCGLVGLTGARRNCRQLRGSSQIACHACNGRIGAHSRTAEEGRDAAGLPGRTAARRPQPRAGRRPRLPLGWSERPAAAKASLGPWRAPGARDSAAGSARTTRNPYRHDLDHIGPGPTYLIFDRFRR
jgi:hypothetical protein